MFVPFLILLLTIGGSVAPVVETFERVESLPRQKYTKRQFAEIEKALSRKEGKIRVMSYNILFDLFEGRREEVNRWKNRFSRVADLIEEVAPDILGVQELYKNQLADLLTRLGKEYAFVSRDPEFGETNGVFYRKSRFELVESTIYETPHESAINISDHLTHSILKDRRNGKSLAIINGHFAFTDPEVREAQTEFAGQTGYGSKSSCYLDGRPQYVSWTAGALQIALS